MATGEDEQTACGHGPVTVAICTYDRADLLEVTLDSVADMSVPREMEWELLVVDNNSTDATREVVAGYEGVLPVRYLLETKQGLSHARNRAVREARGEYIVWTDDDVRVSENWLAAYGDAFRSWPDTLFFGGPLLPWFEGEPPGWLTEAFEEVAGAYAVKDLSPEPVPLTGLDELPFGANMAFRTEALGDDPFDVRLGRHGRNLMVGEETELMLSLVEEGPPGRWVPEARVRHYIPSERQSVRYLRRYYRAHGRISGVRRGGGDPAMLLGRPRWAWRAFLEREALYWMARLTFSPRRWVPSLKKAAYVQGVLLGYRATAESEPE